MADADPGWEASDIFAVIRRLVDDSAAMSGREKIMAHALIDAHGSQHVANTQFFHDQLAIHGQRIGLHPGSPELKAALREQQAARETPPG